MDKHEFAVIARGHRARVVFSGDGERVGVAFGPGQAETEGRRAGAALWELMRSAGVDANRVNGFDVYEENPDGLQVATLRPVLEGARVVWLVLYRADKDASAFRVLGRRQRIGDALDACFDELRGEIVLPHKP